MNRILIVFFLINMLTPQKFVQRVRDNIEWDFMREQTPAQMPLETIKRGKGVCRDLAVLYGWWLERNGYEPKQVVFGLWMPGYDSHEGIIYEQDGKLCFIDNYNLNCGYNDIDEIVDYVKKSQGAQRVCNWHLREWDNLGPVEIWC